MIRMVNINNWNEFPKNKPKVNEFVFIYDKNEIFSKADEVKECINNDLFPSFASALSETC